jgi:hypothetical protein
MKSPPDRATVLAVARRIPLLSDRKKRRAIKALRSALSLVKNGRRPYAVLNLVYYGLVACAMAYTAFDRSLQQALMDTVGGAFTEGPLAPVLDAYVSERIMLATALTFGINLVVGSFVSITLPSLLIPLSGLLVAGLRALLWGVLFTPQGVAGIGAGEAAAGILVVGLLFLEGQGYVLALFGAYLHARAFLWPRSVGATGHLQGYWHGVQEQARIYLLVALVLIVAAVYEVLLAVLALPALL